VTTTTFDSADPKVGDQFVWNDADPDGVFEVFEVTAGSVRWGTGDRRWSTSRKSFAKDAAPVVSRLLRGEVNGVEYTMIDCLYVGPGENEGDQIVAVMLSTEDGIRRSDVTLTRQMIVDAGCADWKPSASEDE
jgi:hypothetical protein